MRISIIGAGYVGLVSAACFANAGHSVTCIDVDRRRIDNLRRGVVPIYEPGLDEFVSRNVEAQRLKFSHDVGAGVRAAEAIFIAVGTPSRRGDGHADLSHVYAACEEIAGALAPEAMVVIKSTVPVGTCDEIESMIAQQRPDLEFYVASNPEFLRAGAAITDFISPDRVVIGAEDDAVRQKIVDIYRPVFVAPTPILFTNRRTSELIKYAANAFLATKIAFINEVANLCERVGADVQDISRGMGLDTRIGPQFLGAGPGFGGSCFPKDALALVKAGEDNETPMRIVEAVLIANDARKRAMARKVSAALGGSLRGKTIALLGLTFKPDTDDMREAPSIALASGLIDLHARLRAYDPAGMAHAKLLLPQATTCCRSEYEAAEGADAIVLATEWNQFRALDFAKLKSIMRAPVVIDLRNLYRVEDVTAYGFRYYRIGAPQLVPAASINLCADPRPFHHRQRLETGLARANSPPPKSKSRRRILEARPAVNGAR
jgi:UDPglucose 6-dehydrogenase